MRRLSKAASLATIVVAGWLVAGGTAHADAGSGSAKTPAQDCSRAGMRKARSVADRAMKAKDYKLAIATLEPFAQGCHGDGDETLETAWLDGDLAVAYDVSGDYVGCIRLMAPLTYPKSDVSRAGNDKVSKALQYNLDHCQKKLDAQFTMLAATACPFAIADAQTSIAVPRALVPKGATAACLALVSPPDKPAAKPAADDADGVADVACPQIAVVANGQGDKQTRSVLGTAFDDQTFCCGVNRLWVGVKDGKSLIRVGADSWVRECHGGTATTTIDLIYEWKGNAITPFIDASVGLW